MTTRSSNRLLKKRLFGWLGFFLLAYLVADVTVLEYFCGNPELGISSYTQKVEAAAINAQSNETAFAPVYADSPQQKQQLDESNLPIDGDDCFCSCTHIQLNGYSIEIVPVVIYTQTHSVLIRHFYPDPHPSLFYRPPRFA